MKTSLLISIRFLLTWLLYAFVMGVIFAAFFVMLWKLPYGD